MNQLIFKIKKVVCKCIKYLPFIMMIIGIHSLKSFASTNVVYGGWDDRLQYYEVSTKEERLKPDSTYFRELASSVCMITFKSYIANSTQSGKSKLYLYGTLGNRILDYYDGEKNYKAVCDTTRFKDDYVVEFQGTGTLIDNNKVLTANHVFYDFINQGPLVCIFNYYKSNYNSLPVQFDDPVNKKKPYVLVNTSDVYNITNTAAQLIPSNPNLPAYDWAVLTIDRNADNKQKRMCYYSGSDIMSQLGVMGNELFTWGFPWGLPMIFTDDGHLTRNDSFQVDLDLYHGNSGSPIFVKINSGNKSLFQYKIVGVVSRGLEDYQAVQGVYRGNQNCSCWVDNYIKPNQASSYEKISFINDVTTVSLVSNNNCNTAPYIEPQQDPKPTPSTQKTLGQNPVINFTPTVSAMHIVRMYYTQNGNKFYDAQISGCTKNVQKRVTMQFLPYRMDYTYKVYYMVGTGEALLTSGSGEAAASTWGSPDPGLLTAIQAMSFVGHSTTYPYQTLQDAITNVPAGYSLHVARGVYNENVTISKPLTIIGEDVSAGNGSSLVFSNTSAPAITIRSNGVTIRNLYFKSIAPTGTAISLENVKQCNIMSNVFTGYTKPIVLINNCMMDTINGNFICGASTIYGIEVNTSTGNVLKNNVLDFGNNIFNFIGCTPQNNTISGNTITNMTWTGQTVNSQIDDVKAKNSITIRDDNINSGGKVNFVAGQKINVSPETKILPGAAVKVTIDPTLQ